MEQILFFFVSFLALASAFYFVFARNAMYAILSLIVTFFFHRRALYFIECTVPRDCTNHRLCRRDHGFIPLHFNDVEFE